MPFWLQPFRKISVELVLAEAVESEDIGDVVEVFTQVGDEVADERQCESATAARFKGLAERERLTSCRFRGRR